MQSVKMASQQWMPSKIICVGRNFSGHIAELQNPVPEELVLFLKPNSAISKYVRCPPQRCRFETEITFLVIDRQFAGMGLGLDLTLVEVQQRLKQKGLPWEKAKAFNGSAVFSEFIASPSSLEGLHFDLCINGHSKQRGLIEEMLFQPDQILAEVCKHFDLINGDLLMTGTPQGTGDLIAGDHFVAKLWQRDQLLLTQDWVVE